MIRIPRRFYDDHFDRDLDSPAILKETKAHYWIDRTDPATRELLSDALFYGQPDHFDWSDSSLRGLIISARATATAINAPGEC